MLMEKVPLAGSTITGVFTLNGVEGMPLSESKYLEKSSSRCCAGLVVPMTIA